jgi:ribose-phosphate pyrophosphokinase
VFGVPLEQLSAVDLLAERVRRLAIPRSVVVAPDFGAAGRAEQVARKLGRPMAVIHKTRLQGGGVRAESITGDVLAMAPIIVDDMVVSGATIEAAVQVLLGAGAQAHITIVASHGVFALGCAGRLNRLPIQQIVVTDTLTPSAVLEVGLSVESVDSMLADAITRLHCAYPMADLVGQA